MTHDLWCPGCLVGEAVDRCIADRVETGFSSCSVPSSRHSAGHFEPTQRSENLK